MCIAIGSPKGVRPPSEEILKKCWDNNEDGAGIAYNHKGTVKILKGFMTWESFKAVWDDLNSKINLTDRGVLVHFRIATHGGVNQECCHPFPLISDEGTLKKLECATDFAVIHNGRISLTSTEAYQRTKMSDTMIFIEKYLSKLATNRDWFNNDTNIELIYELIGSKMAILSSDGEIKFTSGFEVGEDGNYYSNKTYKEDRVKKAPAKTTTYTYGGNYGGYSGYSGYGGYGGYSNYYDDEGDWYGRYSKTYAPSVYLQELPAGAVIKFVDSNKYAPLVIEGTLPIFRSYDKTIYLSKMNTDDFHKSLDKTKGIMDIDDVELYRVNFPEIDSITKNGTNLFFSSSYKHKTETIKELPTDETNEIVAQVIKK